MSVWAIIPARYGSTRFPGKPLAEILGRPMIQHVYERATRIPGVSHVAAATDDQRIVDVVQGFGGQAVLTGTHHPSGTDRLAEAADRLGIPDGDVVINIQGDQPAFQPEKVAEIVQPLLDDPALVMATPVVPITDKEEIQDPNHVKTVFGADGMALYFSRAPIPWPRDGGPADYYKHIGLYAYRAGFLRKFVTLGPGRLEDVEKLEQLRVLENGYRIRVVVTHMESPEVDRPGDVPKVEALIRAGA